MLFSTVVISGNGVPEQEEDEDITDLTIKLILNLIGVKIMHGRNCHRMGKKFLLEFSKAGTCSQIHLVLSKAHRKAMKTAGTWINIHMTSFDSRLFYLARQMKKKEIFEYVGSILGAAEAEATQI